MSLKSTQFPNNKSKLQIIADKYLDDKHLTVSRNWVQTQNFDVRESQRPKLIRANTCSQFPGIFSHKTYFRAERLGLKRENSFVPRFYLKPKIDKDPLIPGTKPIKKPDRPLTAHSQISQKSLRSYNQKHLKPSPPPNPNLFFQPRSKMEYSKRTSYLQKIEKAIKADKCLLQE